MPFLPLLFDDWIAPEWGRPLKRRNLLEDVVPGGLLISYGNIPRRSGCKRPASCILDNSDTNEMNQACVKQNKEGFQVNIDVQQFAPEEISIRLEDDNLIVVEGKHEEKQDEHGYISRHFVRKYRLPEGHDVDKIVSSVSSDGVLTVKAPRLALPEPTKERVIPIERTGKSVKNSGQEEAKENEKH
ncbi:protein lethal(2)essential for life-like [Uranotaenia lowii]|uniref:protein lethal(2)essential for life-like n=1 Tax=Uranotaenia lowii TaxID=190385 RepID=UPI002479EA75|nr:protein lethal(2)essential for life-like [Uranotaenia lowii]